MFFLRKMYIDTIVLHSYNERKDVRRLTSGSREYVERGATMQVGMAKSIADEIRREISLSQMSPGEKLPTDSTLMERFGVGRSTVREAIKLLEAENIVEIRRGKGSFVASKTGIAQDPLGLRFAEKSNLLEELMEVRLLLEPGIAESAAQRRTQEDLRRMEEAVRTMAQLAAEGRDYDAADYRFHIAVAESTHNSVLQRIFPVIVEAIERGYEETAHVHGSVERALFYHRGILDAIRSQDSAIAGKLARLHIEQSLRDIAERKKGAHLL